MSAVFADLLATPENRVEQNISMPACPMAAACKKMTERKSTSIWMIVPGVIFIALGVAIILYPKILVWLAATALIVMGLAMLMMFNFMRGLDKWSHDRPA